MVSPGYFERFPQGRPLARGRGLKLGEMRPLAGQRSGATSLQHIDQSPVPVLDEGHYLIREHRFAGPARDAVRQIP